MSVTGTPIDDTVLYADIDDVETILRSFEFTDTSNPTISQVEKIIEQKTRKIEKETPRAFRELEATDIEVDVNPTYDQERDIIGMGGSTRYRRNTDINGSTTKHIRVRLSNKRINQIDKLALLTDQSLEPKVLEPDQYDINKRDGIIRFDHRLFTKTIDGVSADNLLQDARIRVSYTYSDDYIEPDIVEAVSKLTAYELINSDQYGVTVSEDDNFVSPSQFTSRIKSEAEEIIDRYK